MNPHISIVRLHPDDNVATTVTGLAAGTSVAGVVTSVDIPAGHKLALQAIAAGATVIKYQNVIGVASRDITAGEWVHVHNVGTTDERRSTGLAHPDADPARTVRTSPAATVESTGFMGYVRADGRVGTRNYVGILTSVNCSATVARRIARHFEDRLPEGVDGVVALTHQTGCGMQVDADPDSGLAILRRTLSGYARHPNFAGVLLIGLGCEVNQVDGLLEHSGLVAGERLLTLGIQAAGGAQPAIEAGIALTQQLVDLAATAHRSPCPASHLVLGLQCGGSDGWSGITANPALGAAADRLVAAGGTVLLGETPEIHGAEHLLEARATSDTVREDLRARLAWWDEYTQKHGAKLDNNPSPGNKAGGITTILEKSLGAVAKSGTSPLAGVLRYAEPVNCPGFHFMDSPGYDPCSVTGEIASGANLIAFTTGRGSVFGAVPVPSLKLGTNAALAQRMAGDIDVDCSPILEGSMTIDAMGELVFRRLLALASGSTSLSEQQGIGEAEFVPWQVGVVL